MARSDSRFRAKYGPWAIVAGASTDAPNGVGAEYAAQLAARGLNVVLIARRQPQVEALAADLATRYGVQTRPLAHDLGREDIGAAVAQFTADIDVGLLVYNAGLSPVGTFFGQPLETHLAEVAINCRAPMVLAYTLGQRMRRRGRGGIILMSSLSAGQGSALIANYAATKAYNLILAEGLWAELREQGIDVLACVPSAIAAPNASGKVSGYGATAPRVVADESLNALGRTPSVVPGLGSRLGGIFMRRLLPRRAAIGMFSGIMRRMYPQAS